jgi:hypothetical protein
VSAKANDQEGLSMTIRPHSRFGLQSHCHPNLDGKRRIVACVILKNSDKEKCIDPLDIWYSRVFP